MASHSFQTIESASLARHLPDLDDLRVYAGHILPQAERHGLEHWFLSIEIASEPAFALTSAPVVQQVSGRILGSIRAGDYLATSAAGEFMVILAPGCPQMAVARIAERIGRAISAPITLAGKPAHLSCKIGITTTRDDVLDVDRILANASTALRRCDGAAPAAIRHFSRTTQAQIERHLLVACELDAALADGAIVPWFQPQVSLTTGELTGFEALVRWIHPQKGIIAPTEFLDVAEQSSQIEKIGDAVLTASITALRDWRKLGFDVPRVAVNLSTAQLTNPCLAELIKWELDRLDVDPQHLTIEILESVLGTDENGVVGRNLRALKSIGVRVDLDDFGTGNASIINIRRFGVHRIKIDRAFINGIDREPEQQKSPQR